jgi:PIN domain nuclease of toxin-antitoxin system
MPRDEPTIVLDASALLAYLKAESGWGVVDQAVDAGAAISAVNLAEVYTKIIAQGVGVEPTRTRLRALDIASFPFTEEDASAVAALNPRTRTLGLSLGDRACLSLAERLKLPVLTADRV